MLLKLLLLSVTVQNAFSQTCPAGQYATSASPPSCLACHPTCTTCNGPDNNNCVSCPADKKYLVDGRCSSCPGGQYDTKTVPQCAKCDASCNTCDGPSNVHCLSCTDKQFKVGSGAALERCQLCDQSCGACTDEGPNACLSCNDPGLVFLNRACVPCDKSCATCQDSTDLTMCDMCAPRYFAEGQLPGICTSCSPDCVRCTSPTVCTKCITGMQLKKAKCVVCPPNCSACDGNTGCSECKPGMYLKIKTGTRTCTNCTVCKSSQYKMTSCAGSTNRKCGPCPINCASCTSATVCTACNSGTQLNINNQCGVISLCPANCVKCVTGTSLCAPGQCVVEYWYVAATKTCQLCPAKCASCTSDTVCTTCKSGTQLNNNKQCIDVKCPENCLTCVSGTSHCMPGQCVAGYWYVGATQTCETCDTTCATCTASGPKACKTCPPSSKKQSDNSCKANPSTCPYWTDAGSGLTSHNLNIPQSVYVPPPVTAERCKAQCLQLPSCPAIAFLPNRNPPGCMFHSALSWHGTKHSTSEVVNEYQLTRC